mgnify:CR=1 FL=1
MEKAIEFEIKNESLKEYLEICLKEDNIDYEIKIEERWVQKYKEASEYYQVYCVYVNSTQIDNVKKYIKDYENGTIITDGIEELENAEEEKNNKFKIFTFKNFLKYYWMILILIGILIIIGIKFIS